MFFVRMLGRGRWVPGVLLAGALCSMGTAGCGDSRASVVEHPQAALIANAMRPTAQVSLGPRDSLPPRLDRLRSSLGGPSITSIGALESPPQEVFGAVADVVTDNTGRLFVLDARASEVRVFDRHGRFLTRFGRPGRGPGEFANPQSMTASRDGRVYVGDLTRHVHEFAEREGEFRYVRSIRLNVAALDMCFLNGLLVVHGVNLDEARLIHAYRLSGELVRAFGVVYESKNPDINYALSKGRVACDPRDGLVLFAPASGLPEIVAYDTTGTVRWVTTVRNFRSIKVTEINRGFSVEVPTAGFHRVQSFTYLPSGDVVVQFAMVTRESQSGGPSFVALSTVVLQASSGEGVSLGDSLPAVTALGPSFFVESKEDPFPQLLIHPVSILSRD